MNGRQPFALALSGGSALGAYQAGVYEALAAGGWLPDVVAGASIGAINAALIAGNAPEQRIERLRAFWRPGPEQSLLFEPIDTWRRTGAVMWSLMAGRSGVFAPQQPAWTGDPAGSLYDSRPLHDALGRLVDFDRLNAGEPRFLATTADLGASHVLDGQLGQQLASPVQPIPGDAGQAGDVDAIAAVGAALAPRRDGSRLGHQQAIGAGELVGLGGRRQGIVVRRPPRVGPRPFKGGLRSVGPVNGQAGHHAEVAVVKRRNRQTQAEDGNGDEAVRPADPVTEPVLSE